MDSVAEIKSKLDIVDVIAEYVTLKPAGSNFRGLCPFHHEKSPSFMVSPERQIFHCFGCGAGGDMFTFLMKLEGLEFPEVLKILAQKAGVVLTGFNQQTAGVKSKAMEINALAAEFYQQTLWSEAGAPALNYLRSRQLGDETIRQFQLGYAGESWDALTKYLLTKNFTPADLAAAGVANLKNGQSGCYDRFRERVMFPLWDPHGTVLGFTGRILKDDPQQAKYVNSPESPIYSKSHVIYAVDKAKSAIKDADQAVVVEGQMDVITAHQHNYKNVVASSGTALTIDQLKILKRYTNNILLAFDMDSAGQEATVRGIKTALQLDLNLKIVTGLQGKDPDQCLKENPALWDNALKNAVPFMQYYIERLAVGVKDDDIRAKTAVVQQIAGLVAGLNSKIEQDFWIKFLSQHINYSEEVVRQELQRLKTKAILDQRAAPGSVRTAANPADSAAPGAINAVKDRATLLVERFLSFILKFGFRWPYLLKNYLFGLPEDCLKTARQKDLAKKLNLYYTTHQEQANTEFARDVFIKEMVGTDLDAYADFLTLDLEKDWDDDNEEAVVSEIKRLYRLITKLYWLEQLKNVETALKTSEAAGDRAAIESAFKQLQSITKALAQLS